MNINVTTDKEVLTLKNQTHELESNAHQTFITDRFSSFKDYVKDYEGDKSPYSLYYNESSIEAWPCLADSYTKRDTDAISICTLKFTDELTLLKRCINEDISEGGFVELLRKLSSYCPASLSLKDNIENMKVKKILSMSKSKDTRGNCSYEYSVKDESKSSFNPPESLKFTIPIFKHIEDKTIPFPLDFVFTYKTLGCEEGKSIKIAYRLEMLNLDQFVEKACTVIIEDQMKSFAAPKYWGNLKKIVHTDEWKYLDVPMEFKGIPSNNTTVNNSKY